VSHGYTIKDHRILSSTASKVSVLLGNGNGTFGPLTDVATGLSPYFIITEDFNGDGKQDLAIANIYGGSVTILLNTSHSRPARLLIFKLSERFQLPRANRVGRYCLS
jgi:hypothetical protein